MKRMKTALWTSAALIGLALIAAAPATADQQILDDLIVGGSACIGQDCVNGESFGFDTIRIKENNLRIRAVDTSSTSSFPSRDWQITFNDSSNGGQNKFSIDDIDGGRTPFTIEAGAPSHSLYVDSSSKVGFGTSTPVADLHVKSGNTPTLRLEQDGSAGFTAQTWDLAGNEANLFIRDASNGSTLPFRIFPGAPSDALNIEGGTGDVGLGTTSPTHELHIRESEASATRLKVENVGAQHAILDLTNSVGNWRLRSNLNGLFEMIDNNEGLARMTIDEAGNVTVAQNLIINGTCSAGGGACDGVFAPDYALPTIEEHAAFMWEKSYLEGVGPTPDGPTAINVFQKTTGILNELEKAHIYIEQLHTAIKDLEVRLADLEVTAFEQ